MPEYTLSSWLDFWLSLYKAPMVKSGTTEMYAGIIRLIGKTKYSNALLKDITESDIQNLLNDLQNKGKINGSRTYSKSYLSKVRLRLKQALGKAQKLFGLPTNPAISATLPLSPTKVVLPLTHEEQKLIERQPRYCPFIFTSSKNRKITESAICTAARRLRDATNVCGFTTHVCRHTFVTRLWKKKSRQKLSFKLSAMLKQIMC